jgi:hypothetical protein
MRTNRLCFLLLLLFLGGVAFAQDSGEPAKIRYLIGSIESLQGAIFIRNGEEYDARKATAHLRLKLKNAGDRVKTAEDFIRLCGSKSSVSGKPYQIRFSEGTTMDTEAFFRKRLKAFVPHSSP